MGRPHPLTDTGKARLLVLLGYGGAGLLSDAVKRQHPGYAIQKYEPGAPLLLRPTDKLEEPLETDVAKVLRVVETVSGLYVHSKQHFDEIPRPADYIATFNPLKIHALALLKKLGDLDYYFLDQFALHDENYYEIQAALANLLTVCNAVNADMSGQSSKGPKRESALLYVIAQLGGIYEKHRKPSSASDPFEFIKAVILDSKILTIKPATSDLPEEQQIIDFDKKLKRYLRDATKNPGPGVRQI